MLHIKTEKGFGYAPALAAPDRMHGVEGAAHVELHAGTSPTAAAPAGPSPAAAAAGAASSSGATALKQQQQQKQQHTAAASATSAANCLPSLTSVVAKGLLKLAQGDSSVVAVTAAMPGGTGLSLLGKHLPSRLYDVGIAEQHAVTFSAGLAAGGAKPVCCIYSTFLQRAYDQIVHDVAIQNLPVR